MDPRLPDGLTSLTTPVLADACLRLGIEPRAAPAGLRPVTRSARAGGRVLPVRHFGSVDVFFEAMEQAEGGEVLVIDNGGREDEGCIGDLTVIEARAAGLAGMLVWGCHRDHDEVAALGLPVFSYGRMPPGPREARARTEDALEAARFGDVTATSKDFVLADSDGAIFAPLERVVELLAAGSAIIEKERAQAERVAGGSTLRQQMRFREYLDRRAADPSYSFREHLREVGAEIEE